MRHNRRTPCGVGHDCETARYYWLRIHPVDDSARRLAARVAEVIAGDSEGSTRNDEDVDEAVIECFGGFIQEDRRLVFEGRSKSDPRPPRGCEQYLPFASTKATEAYVALSSSKIMRPVF